MRWLLFILILTGCAAKKTTTSTSVEKEEIHTTSFDYVSQPISTSITIDDICNEDGTLRAFTQAETSGNNSVKVNTNNNRLNLELLTGLSRFKTDTIIKIEYKENTSTREVIRYRTPLWHWFAHLASLLIIFILIKSKLNLFSKKVIKKYLF